MSHSFWQELKRRHVYRVVVAYAMVGWALIEVSSTVIPALHLPDALTTAIVVLVLLGFPVAVVLAWAFEMTPEGVRRTEPAGSPEARPSEHAHRIGRFLNGIIIGVLALAVVGLLWQKFAPAPATSVATGKQTARPAETTPAPAAIPAKSIAVLPFENLSKDKGNTYFASGMQDLILTKLADIGELKVISRTSTLQYGSHPANLTTVGKQLGVATLLEGSVQKAGNEVLIDVQLIDAHTDSHIWAQSYQRTLENVFGVEGEVAEQIAQALKAKLSPAETQRLATALSADPAANDLYLRAEYFDNRGQIDYSTAAWKQAIPLYKQAIAQAPDFALARARLSHDESILAWFNGGGESVKQLNAEARTQAERALALAPDLPETHLAIGYSDYYGRRDYAAALTAFAAALKLRPNDAGALAARGYVLRRQGHIEAAIDSLQQALARDPRNTALASELGATYTMANHYAKAETQFQHALALDPGNVQAKRRYSHAILLRSGDVARALTAAQGEDPPLQLLRVTLLTLQRHYAQALALLAGIADTPDNFSLGNVRPKALQQADLYRLAGEPARARPLYTRALAQSRAQLAIQQGIYLSFVWGNIANAELGLGHTAAGLAAVAQSQAILAKTPDQVFAPQLMEFNAAGYAEAECANLAVPLLAKALTTSGIGVVYSPVMLWLDPAWDPIRHDPRFQALLNKYKNDRPASASSAPLPGPPMGHSS